MAKVIRHPDSQEDLVLGFGKLKIRWMIGPRNDRLFARQVLLPWALPEVRVLPPDTKADVTVGVYLNYADEQRTQEFYESPGLRFTLMGEPELRVPVGDGVYGFFQDPLPTDNAQWRAYAPILLIWTPPVTAPKTKVLSAIEGHKRRWRVKAARKLGRQVGYLDGFGSGFRNPLGGYHEATDHLLVYDKYQGLASYAFHFAHERLPLSDYLTEKFVDPILCECVPVYAGCTNILDYVLPECFIRLEDADRVDWRNWRVEYARRLPYVRQQKELFRTTFNFLSYFVRLAKSPELLSYRRPLLLEGAGAGRVARAA